MRILIAVGPAQPFATCGVTAGTTCFLTRCNDSIRQSLVIAISVVMGQELVNRLTQGAFPEKDQPIKAFLRNASHEPLDVRCEVRRQPESVSCRFVMYGMHSAVRKVSGNSDVGLVSRGEGG